MRDDYGEEDGDSDKCNIIVNYLPNDCDDDLLKSLFDEYGEITVVKVVKDKTSRKSLGYGFVRFVKETDAAAAIEAKNGFNIGHKKLKVSLARPQSVEIRNCKLYITNLPKELTETEVVDLFRQFGEIIECRVLKDRNSKTSKGVAFVQFNLKSQANNALRMDGYRFPGSDRVLAVKFAEDLQQKFDRADGSNSMGNYMGGPGGMTNNQQGRIPNEMYRGQPTGGMGMNRGLMNSMYMPSQHSSSRGKGSPGNPNMDWYGQQSRVMYDPHMQDRLLPGASNVGSMYEQMAMERMIARIDEEANRRIAHMQSSPRTMPESVYGNNNNNNNVVTISIACLPHNADLTLLHDLFSPYGRISSAEIEDSPTNNLDPKHNAHSGRGRVQISGLAQAQYAQQALHGAIIFEGGRPLQVNIIQAGSRTR